jgi:predicted PurR-regulated permease PerM
VNDSPRAEGGAPRTAFLVFFAVALAAFGWWVVRPLLAPVVLAVLTAVICHPAHRQVERALGRGTVRSALASTFLLTALVGLPAAKLGQLFLEQARAVVNELIGPGETHSRLSTLVVEASNWLSELLRATVGGAVEAGDLRGDLLRRLGSALYERVPELFNQVGRLTLGLVLFYLLLVFFLYRGGDFVGLMVEISPLGDGRSRRILRRLEVTVKGVFLGALATALLQGLVGALGFWLTRFENYLVWAALIAVSGLVPVVGTALVWLPAAVYLALNGQGKAALAMLVVGAVVSSVDNLLRPLIIHGRARVHPILVFLALFGGLRSMGPMGLIYGPLLAACLTEVVRIYREDFGPAAVAPAAAAESPAAGGDPPAADVVAGAAGEGAAVTSPTQSP